MRTAPFATPIVFPLSVSIKLVTENEVSSTQHSLNKLELSSEGPRRAVKRIVAWNIHLVDDRASDRYNLHRSAVSVFR